ncbi:hypothetical protein PR048_014330 [Dryococelus australis]|uniref:Uncharacterized protein n=1 Tax=Dryococelus australis TaxID=614101 RepID=A0ABQ9HE33_9NEOP|nr:hypothetical protein PR048_014330 [Dryococelus australis]
MPTPPAKQTTPVQQHDEVRCERVNNAERYGEAVGASRVQLADPISTSYQEEPTRTTAQNRCLHVAISMLECDIVSLLHFRDVVIEAERQGEHLNSLTLAHAHWRRRQLRGESPTSTTLKATRTAPGLNTCWWFDSLCYTSCWTMPLVGGFSRGSPVFPALSFRHCSLLTSITIAFIGSQDLAVESHQNIFTHSAGNPR